MKVGDGYRLITKYVLDKGFGRVAMKAKDCRANVTAKYDLVAIRTEHNLTDYKIAPPRKATAVCVASDIKRARVGGRS